MSSINFNSSAQVALETLRGINTNLNTINDQISTGKKVQNARQNAAIYSISTTIGADVSAFGKVQESLSLAASTLGVARSGAESIVGLLKDAQGLIVDAQGKSASDLATIQTDIDNIKTQIQDIVEAASFNGVNLVDNSVTSVSFLSSLNRTGSGVTTDSISVLAQDLSQTTATAGAAAVAIASFKGAFTATGGVTNNTNDVDSDAAAADGETETVTFAGDIIATGETFELDFSILGANDTVVQYVAREGDTSNEVVLGLQAALQDALADLEAANPTFDADTVGISVQTSSRPSENNVSISVTNNTGSAFNGITVYTETTGGTAGGLLAELSGLDVTSDASGALDDIDDILGAAVDAAAAFGSAQKRIDTQSSFISSLIDNLNSGISALTDADLTSASAKLSQLQVQQQLGLQALSIANQSPQSILALFR
ncbi:flagellin [Parvularcula marina]|uniref:flagellin N-terminal helical domain-containing protein n=1 Tax=Parvularcula marina TaxID=2292771 RepID=UPI00351987FF